LINPFHLNGLSDLVLYLQYLPALFLLSGCLYPTPIVMAIQILTNEW